MEDLHVYQVGCLATVLEGPNATCLDIEVHLAALAVLLEIDAGVLLLDQVRLSWLRGGAAPRMLRSLVFDRGLVGRDEI